MSVSNLTLYSQCSFHPIIPLLTACGCSILNSREIPLLFTSNHFVLQWRKLLIQIAVSMFICIFSDKYEANFVPKPRPFQITLSSRAPSASQLKSAWFNETFWLSQILRTVSNYLRVKMPLNWADCFWVGKRFYKRHAFKGSIKRIKHKNNSIYFKFRCPQSCLLNLSLPFCLTTISPADDRPIFFKFDLNTDINCAFYYCRLLSIDLESQQ